MIADPKFRSWKVGEVTITKLVEQVNCLVAEEFFRNATTRQVLDVDWLKPHFVNERGELILSIHALVVDAPDRRIMVDTCIGSDKPRLWPNMDRLQTCFLDDLQAAGFPRESFDTVLCTHLHVDHVGWNTMLVDGCWTPTFPNARYLIERSEYEYWLRGENVYAGDGWADLQRQAFADSIEPVHEAGLIDLVDGTHRVCEEVRLISTPGHSPGHVSIHISSDGQEALITGDIAHHPSQLVHLDWCLDIDFDAEQAAATRSAVFADAADRTVLVIGTHWAGISSGRISRDGAHFRLDY